MYRYCEGHCVSPVMHGKTSRWQSTDAQVEAVLTLIPSSEKHGGTAELSSSASLRRTGNFSTALMGISPL